MRASRQFFHQSQQQTPFVFHFPEFERALHTRILPSLSRQILAPMIPNATGERGNRLGWGDRGGRGGGQFVRVGSWSSGRRAIMPRQDSRRAGLKTGHYRGGDDRENIGWDEDSRCD